MKINKFYISICVFSLFMFSCKKEDVSPDREDLLSTDTALVLYNVNYVSHTPNSIDFTVDMLQLNGSGTEISYTTTNYVDPGYVSDTSVTFNNDMPFNYPSISEYSTVILFDYSETQAYEDHYVGLYLRRFFEISDSLPNRHVALSSMSAQHNTLTQFHTQNPSNIFDNSWDYYMREFYNRTAFDDQSGGTGSGLFFKGRLMGVIDTLVASPHASGDLSVTLIYGNAGFNITNTDANEIIDHAVANNVKINVISPSNNYDITRIANETGGFVSTRVFEYEGYYQNSGEYDYEPYSSVQVPLLNLDALLMQDVITHRVDVTFSIASENWSSGHEQFIWLNYNGYLIELGIRLP